MKRNKKVRLKESDIDNLVKKIIKEDTQSHVGKTYPSDLLENMEQIMERFNEVRDTLGDIYIDLISDELISEGVTDYLEENDYSTYEDIYKVMNSVEEAWDNSQRVSDGLYDNITDLTGRQL